MYIFLSAIYKTCMYVCMYVYMYVCMYVCIDFVYIYLSQSKNKKKKKASNHRKELLVETAARQNYSLKGFSSTKYIISILLKVHYNGLSNLLFDVFET